MRMLSIIKRLFFIAVFSCIFLSFSKVCFAQNPIITHMYTADPSAHIGPDGRLYLYPSHDIEPNRGCDLMDQYHVFSTSDMVNWTDHGEILRASQVPWGRPEGGFMWAPDCIYKNGTYYYYFPHPSGTDWGSTWKTGIATSTGPAGGFTVQGYIPGLDPLIDPNVFMDDDGQAYFYHGGGGICKGGKLKDNMMEIDGAMQTMQGLVDFHEAAWVFKRNGIYYLTYADNHSDATGDNRMCYATSTNPLGPWTYRGVFMDPTDSYCAHGSVVEYKDQWYVFYFNSSISHNDWLRSTCVDKLYFNADGTIQKVVQTTTSVDAVTGSYPDFVVTDISWNPANPALGNAVTFRATVKNQGAAAGSAGVIAFKVDGTQVAVSNNSTTSIAPGAATTITANGTWTATGGSHKIVAYADSNDTTVEVDNYNNTYNESMTIDIGPAPDLIVTDIAWNPANPAVGNAVTFSATIKNQGTGATPAGVIHGVAFQIDGAGTTLWSDNSMSSIPAGSSITVTVNGGTAGSAWISTPGTHSILAWVDDVNRMVESNENNNQYTKNLTVGSSGGNNLAQGKTITASSYTQTYAAANANDGNVNTYWEGTGNAYPNTLTVDLGSVQSVGKVVLKLNAAWGSRTQALSVLSSTDNTTYTTRAASNAYTFDPASENTVTITFTNTSARYVRLNFTANSGATGGQAAEFEVYGSGSAGTPDLIVTDISWNLANPAAGNAVTFSAVIKNQGTGATTAGVINGVSFLVDGTQVCWSDNNTSSIAAGASITVTSNGGPSGAAAWTATTGNHTVTAWVDDVNRISESNESNNSYSEGLTIGGSGGSGDIIGKIYAGYQGWFNCYGDSSPVARWRHWSAGTYQSNAGAPAPGYISFELYPDVREYTNLYQTNLGNLNNGQPAKLFSSYSEQTVNKHFEWMQTYGIDGAALQRFGGELADSVFKSNRDSIASKVKTASETYGRKFYIMYDISGMSSNFDTILKNDWTGTITGTLNLTASGAYAKQDGKPVVCIWGIGFNDRPGDAAQSLNLVNWFKAQGCYVIGGVPTQWRKCIDDSKAGFENVYKAFNMISPWSVGRFGDQAGADQFKNNQLVPDLSYCNANGIAYQPVMFPGFAWSNWNGGTRNQIPRQHGDFMWRQAYNMKSLGISTGYIAMFDEYDEGTAIAKAAENSSMIPNNQYFLTLDADGVACSSDFYLRLSGDITRMMKGQIPLTATHPTSHQ